MALVVKTIGSAGGRDFSTIAGWVASLPANLVTDGNSQEGDCYNDSEFTVTATIAINGHTTDSTHNITLTTGAGQSFRDNANVRTNPLTYDATKGVGIRATAFLAGLGVINGALDSFTTISNLQISGNGNNASGIESDAGESGANVTVQNCIVLFGTGFGTRGVAFSANNCIIRNCVVVYNGTATSNVIGILFNHVGSQTGNAAYFCTVVVPSNGTSTGTTAIKVNYGSVTVENIAAFGYATLTTGTVTATTCQTDIASPPTGWTQKTYNNSYFVDTTADWRLASGSPAQAAGTSDSTNGANDISGLARPQGSNWDIGAWELAAAASGLGARLSDRANVLIGGGLVLA